MVRQVLSFYKLTLLNESHLKSLCSDIKHFFRQYDVLGRVYIAPDGLNAQVSVDVSNIDEFCVEFKQKFPSFSSVYFNKSPHNADYAFEKLSVRLRPQVVGDDIPLDSLDASLVPNNLPPRDFHCAIEKHLLEQNTEKSIFLDIRNAYELELGNFPKTTNVPVETFREYMKRLKDNILPNYNPDTTNVLMVCTGGIRCSKAGLVMRNWGWKSVNMLHGGITRYLNEMGPKGLFQGLNFTFDKRRGERFSGTNIQIVSRCGGCGVVSETVNNCVNSSCNRMTVQCGQCKDRFHGACGPGCHQIIMHPNLAVMHKQVGAMHNKHHRQLM